MGEGDIQTRVEEDRAERGEVRPGPSDAGRAGAERFVRQLHGALRRFGSYPPTNPLCVQAAEECHAALREAKASGTLTLDVGQNEIVLAGETLLAGDAVSAELAALFHRLNIGSIHFETHASARELAALCQQLAEMEQHKDRPPGSPLPRLEGCVSVQLAPLRRLRVLDARDLSNSRLKLISHYGRSGGDETDATAGGYLYPVGRAWVLVDSTADISRISMVDLAFVLDDPPAFAQVLDQLSEDDGGATPGRSVAFERNFREIAGLFAVLDGSLKERMLARLASALLQLPPDRRRRLLTEQLVPSLIEGRSDAAVLRHLPDTELAEALALTHQSNGTRERLGRAVDHLEVSPARTSRLFDLTYDILIQPDPSDPDQLTPGQIHGLEGRSINLERDTARDLRRFEVYDLSVSPQTEGRLRRIGASLDSSDAHSERLRCIRNVLWTVPSAEAAAALLEQVFSLFQELNGSRRWLDVAEWTLRFMNMTEADRELEPGVSTALEQGLTGMCSSQLFVGLLRNAARDDRRSRAAIETLVATIPGSSADVLTDLLRERIDPPAVIDIMSRNVDLLAESIRTHINDDDPFVVRCLLRALGAADPGYEMLVAAKMRHPDPMVAREAYRALARMRTPKAVALVGDRLRKGDALERRLAAATLGKFQEKMADQIALGALGEDGFARADPSLASLLLKNVRNRSAPQLSTIVGQLARYRFHFWRPELARLGRQARALRTA